jgi:hypothetical protein
MEYARSLGTRSVWISAMAASLLFALKTQHGPVILQLSGSRGVHTGDVAFAASTIAIASVVTVILRT